VLPTEATPESGIDLIIARYTEVPGLQGYWTLQCLSSDRHGIRNSFDAERMPLGHCPESRRLTFKDGCRNKSRPPGPILSTTTQPCPPYPPLFIDMKLSAVIVYSTLASEHLMDISTEELQLTRSFQLVCQGVLPSSASALTSRSLTGVSVFSRQLSGIPSDIPPSVCA